VSTLREWTVAGGLLETAEGLLLVRNVRRGGHEDWSTPGGVIDETDADVVAGLTREVAEETGLAVREWLGPVYEVRTDAPDLGWRMRCEVHRAVRFDGELRVDDPDGIVVEAAFVPPGGIASRLADCPPWVREPLEAWLEERWEHPAGRAFHYEVHGVERSSLRVVRTAAP
jgi:8-oxo-dGTP pyrophosphatase MutT (NUDIX family)